MFFNMLAVLMLWNEPHTVVINNECMNSVLLDSVYVIGKHRKNKKTYVLGANDEVIAVFPSGDWGIVDKGETK